MVGYKVQPQASLNSPTASGGLSQDYMTTVIKINALKTTSSDVPPFIFGLESCKPSEELFWNSECTEVSVQWYRYGSGDS